MTTERATPRSAIDTALAEARLALEVPSLRRASLDREAVERLRGLVREMLCADDPTPAYVAFHLGLHDDVVGSVLTVLLDRFLVGASDIVGHAAIVERLADADREGAIDALVAHLDPDGRHASLLDDLR